MPDIQPTKVIPKEAVAHLRKKLQIPTRRWDDLRGPLHAKAYTVAGATKAELLNDLHKATSQALEQGQTITAFRKNFDKAVQEHGWSYKGKRGWRTRVIYDTNLRTAHMAGRWQQIQRTKATRPYLQYNTVGDRRVRPQHQAWQGTTLLIDDDWWDSHYPPNGWGCRCTVITLSERQMTNAGIKPDKAPPIKLTERINARTGEIYGKVPAGIDVGWDHNVGKEWLGPDIAFGKALMELPAPMRKAALAPDNLKRYAEAISPEFKPWANQVLANSKDAGAQRTLGYLAASVIDWLAINKHVVPKTATIAVTGGELRHVAQLRKEIVRGLPDSLLVDLPIYLANRRAVLWGKRHENLTYVLDISKNNRDPKLVIGINFKRKGELINHVVTGALVDRANLRQHAEYELIEGEL